MTKTLRALYALALLAIVGTLTIAPAHGQAVYGTLFGTVTDKTGAVVAGATVTVTDVAKGTVDNVITNGAGDYSATHLVPDTYDLKIEVKGFKTYTAKGIVVQADTAPRVDVALEVAGSAGETIEVNAESLPQLKTDRADVSTVFNQQEVADLPVGDQNFTNLQLLLPGAQQLGWSHAASENPQASKQIQIDGQAFGGVAFELDGTDNQDPILGIIVINPALDAVTETKITTQNFDAEFGKAVSSVVTAQTRSGTNKFHGSVYDFRTDNANQARDPYTQPERRYSGHNPISAGFKNRFGGSLGGPIWKDRAFFFGNYEAQRQKVGSTAVDTLPSNLLIETCLGNKVGPSGIAGCDFSEYNAESGLGPSTGAIYRQTEGGPVAFTGNVIPTALLSPQALALLKYLEPFKPNLPGRHNGLTDNFSQGGNGLFNSDQWTVRGDFTVNQKIGTFARYSRFTDTLTGKVLFGDAGGPGFGLGGFGGVSNGTNQSLAAGVDFVINPKLVADVRVGWYGYKIITSKYDQSTTFATTLGIPGINLGDRFTNGSPGFLLANVGDGGTQPVFGAGLGVNRCNCPLTEDESQLQIVSNWTKSLGNHAIKFGADIRFANNLRVPSDNDRSGVLNFGTGPTSNGTTGGLGFATFALGQVTSFNRYVSVSTNAKEHQNRPFFYIQDTWQASHKLTLNLGVRWELYFPESVNAKGNGALLNLDDGYLHVAGYGGLGNNMGWKIQKAKQFEPRIGLAYQLDPKTVIRSGYGRSFDVGVFGSIFGHVVTQNLPILANQNVNATGGTTSYAFSLADGPPSGASALTQYGTVPANGLLPNPGHNITSKARPNPLQFPTLDAWNLSIQRSINPSLSITAAYVGNKGTHSLSAGDGNNTNPNESAITLPASFSATGQTLHYDPKATDPTEGTKNPFYVAPDGGTANQKLLQRYVGGSLAACKDANYTQPTYAGINLPAGACGWDSGISYYGDNQNNNFNALQVTVAQKLGKSASINANYQWAAAHDFNSNFATWSRTAVYGNNNDVRKQSLVSYGSYELPFGKGKHYFAGANRLTDFIVGGYQLSGVVNWSSGLPFTLGLDTCRGDIPDSAPCRPNVVGKLKTKLSSFSGGTRKFYSGDKLLTSGQFSHAGLDKIGNSPRNAYFGPSFFNSDLSITKKISIWESVQAQFRADAYNAFNHINAGNPSGNVQSDGIINGQAPGGNARLLELSARIQF